MGGLFLEACSTNNLVLFFFFVSSVLSRVFSTPVLSFFPRYLLTSLGGMGGVGIIPPLSLATPHVSWEYIKFATLLDLDLPMMLTSRCGMGWGGDNTALVCATPHVFWEYINFATLFDLDLHMMLTSLGRMGWGGVMGIKPALSLATPSFCTPFFIFFETWPVVSFSFES